LQGFLAGRTIETINRSSEEFHPEKEIPIVPGHPERAEEHESIRKRGKPLCVEEQWMVINVFSRCAQERQHSGTVGTLDPYQRTASYPGVGRRQVVEIMHHFRQTGQVPMGVQEGNHLSHRTAIAPCTDSGLREFILRKHCEGVAITARHVQDFLHEVLGQEIAQQTIRDHRRRLGFHDTRTKTKSRSLREKPYVRQQRHTFLHHIRRLREAGYPPVYIDESFLHHHHGNQFSWFSEGDFLPRPTGKGRRWCFIHALLEQGVVSNAFRIFEAKQSRGDYHHMFNAECFLDWWQRQLLPNLPAQCVMVVDQASYHLVPEEHLMPSTMRKAELQQWLSSHGLAWEPHWLRPRLQQALEKHIDKTPLITKLAAKHGHQGLILPVHHPELNPIELVWAIVKNECARLLRTGTQFKAVRQHLEAAFTKLSSDTCRKLYETVRQTEATYWKLDEELDEKMIEQAEEGNEAELCSIA
jgi:transposase